jgi:YidC/Oxa1 family membrane protein insertase
LGSIWAGFNGFLRGIIDLIYNLVQSHGWSVVLFTLLIRVVLLPFDIKSRQSMRRMSKLNPKIQALQKKYANDKEKFQQKQAELYKKEKINPLASCLPMLLTMPVLFAMFAVMRNVANEELVRMLLTIQNAVGALTDPEQIRAAIDGMIASGTLHFEPWLWIKNLWMADSPFSSVLPLNAQGLSGLQVIAGLLDSDGLQALKDFVETQPYLVVLEHFNAVPMPGVALNLLITQLSIFKNPNGYFILPILAAATQYLSTLLQPMDQQNTAAQSGGQQAGTGQIMKVFFPLFSLWICATSNSAFSLYWLTANVIQIVQQVALNWYFDKQDKKLEGAAKEVTEQ